jgi:hypothetical protein
MYTNPKLSINLFINNKCFSKEGKLLAKIDIGDEEQLVFRESYSVNDDLPF